MDFVEKKKKIISYFMENNILISSDLISILENNKFVEDLFLLIEQQLDFSIILKKLEYYQQNPTSNIVSNGNLKPSTPHIEQNLPLSSQSKSKERSKVNIIKDHDLISQKREVSHFVSYFASRYKQLEQILKKRDQLSNVLSIARLKAKKDREVVSIIGIIRKKEKTKNDNIILTVEDLTGEIKVLINKSNHELLSFGEDLVQDETIGVVGMNGDNILFSNQIIQPDIPLDKEFKKNDKEEYVIFLSDIHVGSNYFLKDEFKKFISWIRQETGTEKQREIASKVKNIFILGDIVDGVGIYPNQENELELLDIYDQYKEAAKLISQIPKEISIIICPGNHDAGRLSEPQPKLSEEYAKPLYELENVISVSNPAMINICSVDDFSGFDILLYHGYSFDYYVANVDSLRLSGGYDRADLIMKFLLKRRHLAPTYKSTLFIPEITNDALVIDQVPDFFVTGHIHKTAVSNYRNITLISGSCWQSKTSFQEKVGHHPEPARVPVVNLKTRKVTILNFES